MKKIWKRTFPLALLALVLAGLTAFYAVTLNRSAPLAITEPNLARGARVTGCATAALAADANRLSACLVTRRGQALEIGLGQEQTVNALLLNEIGQNIRQFSVWYKTGGEWALCYRQNEVGINRLATFYPVETDALKIVIDDFQNTVRLADVQVYDLQPRERETPLRVTSYITPGSLNDYDPETNTSSTVGAACFDVVTDVQFIAYARLQADGSVRKEPDADNLAYLKAMIGARDVNIFVTVFPPLDAGMADVLRENMDRAVDSVVQLVLDSGTDGADFDWEYPANSEEYALYSEFLIKVKAGLAPHGKMLSVALSPWGGSLSQQAIDAIDQLQLMAYDLFDHNGDNNSYAGSTESAVQYMLDQGFRPGQINLGISYYGRPSDASGVWVDYRDPAYTPNEYIMFENHVWFNTPATVRDKTVYAILRGLGGIMTFSQNEDLPVDNELSLTRQIGRAKAAFSTAQKEAAQ